MKNNIVLICVYSSKQKVYTILWYRLKKEEYKSKLTFIYIILRPRHRTQSLVFYINYCATTSASETLPANYFAE